MCFVILSILTGHAKKGVAIFYLISQNLHRKGNTVVLFLPYSTPYFESSLFVTKAIFGAVLGSSDCLMGSTFSFLRVKFCVL